MHQYALDNAEAQATDRIRVLESCFDAATQRFLLETGLTAGWRCLEVGAGGGSVGRWLSEVVGVNGRVTVTDIATDLLDPGLGARGNVDVLQHNVVTDPLPDAAFDLVNARLVLVHLPERYEVLRRLIRSLRPGGWLVLEEFDCRSTPVLMAPDDDSAELFGKVHDRFLDLLTESGADVLWARKAFAAFVDAGLGDICSSTFGMTWRGGSTGINLHLANTRQLAGRLLETGLTQDELDRFLALVHDPRFAVHSYPLVSIRGRRETSDK